MSLAQGFLERLNTEYFKLHKEYEILFWVSYMGDHSIDKKKDEALRKRDAFKANKEYLAKVRGLLKTTDKNTKDRLQTWATFFESNQLPPHASTLKEKASALESKILEKQTTRKEGYIDPHTKKFVVASELKMHSLKRNSDDEKIRRACFEGLEKLALDTIKDYVVLVGLRNQFAQALGYTDFYDYKVRNEDGMTKKELFSLFDTIYKKTKYSFKDIRTLEKKHPGLRKPWNFSYILSGNFTKEEDPYFQFDDALLRWGQSFAALGIEYRKGSLQLDLLDRNGKYNNGFCHWPNLVHFENGKKMPGASNFTCNLVVGQIGAGSIGYNTLFHEGGHAAHLLTTEQKDVILNHEYAPMSTAWAETQSMFLDTMFSSIDWKTRYALNKDGASYPFDLYERKVRKLNVLSPTRLNGIIFVANYEKDVYEAKNLSIQKVLQIAKKNNKKYYDMSVDSISALNVPHIYSWESSASYHGYGLAELALNQWREYFYNTYGYIVDNKNVGKEMANVWKLGAKKTFKEFVILATGKKLSADAFLKEVTLSVEKKLRIAKEKIARLAKVPRYKKPIQLNAQIQMMSGKKVIANNKKSFEDMALRYKNWLLKQK